MTVPAYQPVVLQPPPGQTPNLTVQGGRSLKLNPELNRAFYTIMGTNIPTTIDINSGYVGQKLSFAYKQSATPTSLVLGPSFVGTLAASYSATNTANARDVLECMCVDGYNWGVLVASQGYTV